MHNSIIVITFFIPVDQTNLPLTRVNSHELSSSFSPGLREIYSSTACIHACRMD